MLRVTGIEQVTYSLKWKLFVAALATLKYRQIASKGGSARHFQRGEEDPLTFHEPHGNDTIKQGTLTEYLRKLGVTRDDFSAALDGGAASTSEDEDKYRRTLRSDGSLVSNCLACLNVVADSLLETDIEDAELVHVCPI